MNEESEKRREQKTSLAQGEKEKRFRQLVDLAFSQGDSQPGRVPPELQFHPTFEKVAQAVPSGQAEYGVLPFENSSVSTVADITEIIYCYGAYINTMVPVKIEHCLCAAPGTTLSQVATVLSHPQALLQCRENLKAL